MKSSLRPLAVLVASIILCSAAIAQTPTEAPASTAAPVPATSATPATSARAGCRTEVDGKSLTGEQRKAAMHDCMKTHADACRQQAADKGLAKGPDRKAFMHQCMQGA